MKPKKITAREVKDGDVIRWPGGFQSKIFEAVFLEDWDAAVLTHDWQPPRGGPTRCVLPAEFPLERVPT